MIKANITQVNKCSYLLNFKVCFPIRNSAMWDASPHKAFYQTAKAMIKEDKY